MAAPPPKAPRPSIVVAVNATIQPEQLTELLLGIEEEGIPHDLTHSDEINPLTLAHQASTQSRLGVGIGLSLEFAVVTTEKLPAGRPYIARHLNQRREWDRALGANAARIVKGVPLHAYR
ncbi:MULTISPECIES: glycerol dehydratase reactivase beta/small subunit family protein [unclassified Luteococcus]|uniref:glycerol dehydratase reactivase beta/small subunit family protein n=1 Tax=unclassified Luteococcus TaxID=2639923 RepID=UPI00313E9E6D